MKRKGGFWSVLPLDLKVEIFGLVPEKNLESLRFVCKDWNYVISRFFLSRLCPPNPRAPVWGFLSFVYDDSHKGTTLQLMPFVTYAVEHMILSLLPPEQREAADLRDCCNGMVLFANNCQYYVGNPITRQRFHVPVNPSIQSTTRSSLVFDPSLFLLDNKDPFFKIVSFVRPAQEATFDRPMMLDIYTSDKAEWCSHVVELEPHYLYGFEWLQRYVYFNRALYSLSTAKYLVCIDNIIPAAPNTHGLRARAISLPDRDEKRPEQVPDHPSYLGCIGNCSERFYYSNVDNVDQDSSISVWMLGGSEWELMCRISINRDIGYCKHFDDPRMEHLKSHAETLLISLKNHISFQPCAFHPKDENGVTVFIALSNAFISYNVKTRSTTLQQHLVKKIKVDGNWFFPFSPCRLRL